MASVDHTFEVSVSNPQTILFSADVERASRLYQRLGFVETFGCPAMALRSTDIELDGYKIGFASIDSSRADHGLSPSTSGHRATITLWTPDTEATYRSVTAAGVFGIREPEIWLDRLLIAWIAGPDGHPIQLAQKLPR